MVAGSHAARNRAGLVLTALGLMLAAPAVAQTASPGQPATGGWVDPPAEIAPPPAASPAPAPAAPEPASPQVAAPTPQRPPAVVADQPRPPAREQARAPEPPSAPAREQARAPEPPAAPAREQPREVETPRPPTREQPREAAPAPAQPSVAERAPRQTPSRAAQRAEAARDLALDYLAFWSASNAEALQSTPEFYTPRVTFHGRSMSAQALFDEKRRFVQRWPVRDYRHRSDSIRTACDPAGESCTVRSVFDFDAANPARSRRSRGVATLELVVTFANDRPFIAAESSIVHDRGRSEASVSLEDTPDE